MPDGRKHSRAASGQALVEFTLVLPLLLVLFFSIIEFSLFFYTRVSLRHVVRESARFAVTGNVLTDSTGTPMTRVQSIERMILTGVAGVTLAPSNITVTPADGGGPGAVVRIAGPAGTRTLPVEELFVLPSVDPRRETALDAGEIVTEVVVPPPAAGVRSTYRKVRARASWDFALVGGAFVLRMADGLVREARVVLSGVAPVPWRSKPVEAALTGRRLDPATISGAAAAAVVGAEPLGDNGYKVPLLSGLVQERLESLARA